MVTLAPDLAPRYFTFWSINGPLDRARLRRQLLAFKAAGLHGVVFHPRFYPGIPPYLSDEYIGIVAACILDAKELGLRFWLYDENGWPSGTGDGKVLAQYPDSGAMRLDLTRTPTPDSLGTLHTDAANRLVPAGSPGAQTWHLTPRKVNYVDSLDPRVLGHFLELIHERYRAALPVEAFDYIEAIFFDEPESGMIKDPFAEVAGIPWSRTMPDRLRAAFGADYTRVLPLLFAQGDGSAAARVTFWELVTDSLIDGFFAPYHAWCRRHGKQFIGHVKGEEHPLFQLPMVGSCHRVFRHLSLPGIDSLERYPALDFYPRQASSAARQFGVGRAMVECFGGAGWGASPEDLERYLLWLGRNGITDFVFHLSQYRLDTAAITDWPPSEPLHLSWTAAFPSLLARVSRELTTRPPAAPDTLVVAPYRGLMAAYEPWELMQTNAHNASTYPDTPAGRINRAFLARLETLKAAGIAYDVVDERTLEEDGRREGATVRIGRATYRHLVIADGAQLRGPVAVWRTDPPSTAAVAGVVDPGSGPGSTSPATSIPLTWELAWPAENAWLLPIQRTAPATFAATFVTGAVGALLHFADDVPAASLDGIALALRPGEEGTCVDLPALGAGPHTLTFRTAREVPGVPFVWLKGAFAVQSKAPYTPGPTGTICTDGPFTAEADAPDTSGELVAAGLPFLQRPLVATTTVTLPAPTRVLRLAEILGDALHVAIDDESAGWVWGPDWTLTLARELSAGPHRLRVALAPSTFNHFGPHHYYNGDWHVVSPGQVVGDKNFADAPDAPERTHVAAWHFKPFRLPARLHL